MTEYGLYDIILNRTRTFTKGVQMEYYTVKQLAERRGVSERAIYKQLKTHEEALKGHVRKEQGKTWVDETGLEILQKSSNKSPVVYVENEEKQKVIELEAELRALKEEKEELIKAKAYAFEKLDAFRDKYEEFVREKAELEAKVNVYIEDRQAKEEEIKAKTEEMEQLNKELTEKSEEVEKVRKMGFFEFRKWKKDKV